jgi:hypothetical protein
MHRSKRGSVRMPGQVRRVLSPLEPIRWAAQQSADREAQHGPVRVLVKNGEPVLSEIERKQQANLFVESLAPLAKPESEYPD